MYLDSRTRMLRQTEVERDPDLPEAIRADRHVSEAASIDVPMQEPPQVDLLAAPLPMDVDRDVERDLDHLVAVGIRRHQEDLDQIVGEYPRVSILPVKAHFL